VQFSLVGIPFHSTVSSAIAELWAANAGGNPTHGLHDITAPWSQSTVTWNKAPSFAVSPTATATISGTGFWSFDVTPDVDADVNLFCGGYGWLIKDEVETASIPFANYVSLEDDSVLQLAKRPRLTVDYTPPPCTTNADCADQNFCTTKRAVCRRLLSSDGGQL